MVIYSDSIQLDTSSGLWYKFGYEIVENNKKWHILSSGDRDSLEKNSIIYHDHFWQSNGHWYFQGRLQNQHIIGKDVLKEGIKIQNQRRRLELTEAEKQYLNLTSEEKRQLTEIEVNQLAIYRARQAYGNSGYSGSNHGIEVDQHLAHILDRQVQQYQASVQTSISTNFPQSTTKSPSSGAGRFPTM
ncbi:hypothetical protein NIES37_38210 [Tolypothrix tenuis PCC 7101]|uniref:Uncharacterized protein n=1 Tax=Tolypothrix tenuis PCC 7101 TaxID=231146 RepID=A0A1Z4N259_9CYAN|nr:hypothetical protein [Aulosira sp. FACHB-113]BAY99838.1 hypothetical protein NIES37_38210 [Tolypothrix tenuis PCC 7101]BAZ76240.1 hypothetical protein NIES50_48380 [Aulosira laxa NIES-50]